MAPASKGALWNIYYYYVLKDLLIHTAATSKTENNIYNPKLNKV